MERIVLIFFLIIPLVTPAQRSSEIGLMGGGTWYNGELNPDRMFYQMNPAGSLLYRHNFNYRYSFRASALHGAVSGNDLAYGGPFHTQRALSFRSNVTELSGIFEFNFLPYEIGHEKFRFTTFVFGGLGIFKMNPRLGGPGSLELRGLPNEPSKKYNVIQPSIPFGMGIKVSLFRKLGIFAEWGMRKTFTDYLDDVSTTWNHGLDQGSGTIAGNAYQAGYQRGFAASKDWYSFAGIGLVYLLKKPDACPAYNK